MTTSAIFILCSGLIFLLYTLSFSIYFHRTADLVFSPSQKRINSILIWVVPFLWIVILKAILKPSTSPNKKKVNTSDENSTDTGWTNHWILFLHGTTNSTHSATNPNGHSEHTHSNDNLNHANHAGHDSIYND